MDRYELKDGAAAKFWEAEVDGSKLTVRFGRIGTQGQAKEKTFASPDAAQKEEAKLIKEKTGKGYVKTGDVKADAAEAPAAEPALPDAAVIPAEAKKRKLFSARPLPTRMRPEPIQSPDKAWAQLQRALRGASFAFDETPPVFASADLVIGWLRQFYNRLVGDLSHQKAVLPFMEWLAGSHGPLIAMQAISEFYIEHRYGSSGWRDALSVALRRVVTQAPEADYDETLAWCLEQCQDPADWKKAAYFAFLLADDRAVSHALQPLAVLKLAEAQGARVDGERLLTPLVVDAPPVEAAAWRIRQSHYYYYSYFYDSAVSPAEASATLMAVARANGAPAAPSLGWLLPYGKDRERAPIAEAVLETREDGALAELLPFLREEWIQRALDQASGIYPDFVFRECLAASASGRTDPVIKARLIGFVARHGLEKARQWAEGLDVKALDRLEATFAVEVAPVEALPVMFRDPPWRRKKNKSADNIVLTIEPVPTPFSCSLTEKSWTPACPWRAEWRLPLKDMKELPNFLVKTEAKLAKEAVAQPASAPTSGMSEDQALAWLAQMLTTLYDAGDIRRDYYSNFYHVLERLPEPLAIMFWEQTRQMLKETSVYWTDIGSMMPARFGERALPGLLKLIETDPAALECARWVDAPDIAPLAARAFSHGRLKKARALATDWLRGHWRTALTRLIPDAVGAPGETRDAAESVLRWLVKEDPRAAGELPKLVAEYARSEPRVGEALEQVLSRDPLGEYPAKIARLPSWFVPAALTRPQLRKGGALPDEAIIALGEMLAFSAPNAVYAGVPMTREVCTQQSLSAFVWDLFTVWTAAGAPSKESWALRAVGWLGDDECARRLTPLIRKWPGESAHARAVMGLDVLTDIGSDVALMNLNGIAEKLKFKGLQEKAREKIAAIAEARELTPEELSDRLAPDLDLDERGGLDLDFGQRRFRAGFDEFLKPWVKDADTVRLKELPKPNKSDDAELSAAAVARWAALKKDARAVASLQLTRLEVMLAAARRVRPDVFWSFFASHPLIRHLAQRLVWGLYDDDASMTRPSLSFRVGEDLTFSDSSDNPAELDITADAKGFVGLVHPLQMAQVEIEAWGVVFGDYEIMQPFPQLSRETFALTDDEKQSASIDRFDGVEVESTRLRGMAARGWPLGSPQDGGGIWWIEREVNLAAGGTVTANLSFSDGLYSGGGEDEMQTLGDLELDNNWRKTGRRFGDLDPIAASEMLRGLTLLAQTGKS
jgi:predicted DNA-binding WGR domain protein